MKKQIKTIFGAFAVLTLLASCTATSSGDTSSSSGSAASSSGTVSSSSGAASSSASSGTTVSFNFWTTFGQTATAAVEKLAADFSEIILEQEGVTVNITVSYQGAYDDVKNKITQGFSAGNVPTMAIAYPDHVAAYLDANPNYVYKLDDYMDSETIGFNTQSYLGDDGCTKDDIIGAYLDEGCQYALEGYYSMPLMKSSEVLYYNADAVELGMQDYDAAQDMSVEAFLNSLTFPELLEFGQYCLDNKEDILNTMEHAIWYDSDSNFFITQMYQRGIGYSSIDESGNGIIDFESGANRTAAEAMVTELKKYSDSGCLTTKGAQGTYGSDAFTTGEVIFEIGSSGGAGYNAPTGGTFDFGVAKVPSYAKDDNALYVSQGPTLAFLRNPSLSDEENDLRMKYAWQFAKFMTNADNNTYMCVSGSEGYTPVRYSAQETSTYQQYLSSGEIYGLTADVLLNDIDGAYYNTATFPGSSNLRDQVGGILTTVFTDTKDVTTAFDDAISTAKTYM